MSLFEDPLYLHTVSLAQCEDQMGRCVENAFSRAWHQVILGNGSCWSSTFHLQWHSCPPVHSAQAPQCKNPALYPRPGSPQDINWPWTLRLQISSIWSLAFVLAPWVSFPGPLSAQTLALTSTVLKGPPSWTAAPTQDHTANERIKSPPEILGDILPSLSSFIQVWEISVSYPDSNLSYL